MRTFLLSIFFFVSISLSSIVYSVATLDQTEYEIDSFCELLFKREFHSCPCAAHFYYIKGVGHVSMFNYSNCCGEENFYFYVLAPDEEITFLRIIKDGDNFGYSRFSGIRS